MSTNDPAENRRARIGSVVIHCHEYDRMVRFWSEALGYAPDRPTAGGWVILRAPDGRTPHLSLQRRDRSYPWRYEPGADYVVLEDPDGNLFCVVQEGE